MSDTEPVISSERNALFNRLIADYEADLNRAEIRDESKSEIAKCRKAVRELKKAWAEIKKLERLAQSMDVQIQ